jgi:Fe-S-cluster containining protein
MQNGRPLESDIRNICQTEAEYKKFRSLRSLPVKGSSKPFSCAFLSDTNRCRIYERRPILCRSYPLVIIEKEYEISINISDDCADADKYARILKETPTELIREDQIAGREIKIKVFSFYDKGCG